MTGILYVEGLHHTHSKHHSYRIRTNRRGGRCRLAPSGSDFELWQLSTLQVYTSWREWPNRYARRA